MFFNSSGQGRKYANLNQFISKKTLNWYCLGQSKAGKGFCKRDSLATGNTSLSMRAHKKSSQSYAGIVSYSCTAYMSAEFFRQYSLDMFFESSKLHQRGKKKNCFKIITSTIYFLLCMLRRVICAQPSLTYQHLPMQSKLQSSTKNFCVQVERISPTTLERLER